MCITTAQPMGPGTRSSFTLLLPHEEVPLELSGEVVWSRLDENPAMGVRFTEDDRAKRERLIDFVEKLIKDSERL